MSSSAPARYAIVAARNEADRIGATVGALREAVAGIEVFVADDASEDGTGDAALAAGATLIRRRRPHGKGGNVTAACEAALSGAPADATFLLCDGDLGATAGVLAGLVEAVEANACDLAIAAFSRKVGGGVGAAKGFAGWAIRSLSGFEAGEPISGQRAMRATTLRSLLPFAPRYGMEAAMTIDAVRAGFRVAELELELSHRATGKTPGGFAHRARQLGDISRAAWSRRG